MYRIALNVTISHRRNVEYRRRHVADLDSEVLESIPAPTGQAPDDRVRELYRVIDRLDDPNGRLSCCIWKDATIGDR